MARNSIRRKAERQGISFDDAMEQAAGTVPSGRLSTAEEVANTIAFLLTDAAGNIVGEFVKISRGQCHAMKNRFEDCCLGTFLFRAGKTVRFVEVIRRSIVLILFQIR